MGVDPTDLVIREAWEARFGPARPAHMRFVTPYRARRHLVRSVVGDLRKLDVDRARKHVATVLDGGGWATVDLLIELAEDFAAQAWAALTALPARQRPDRTGRQDVGERACVQLAGLHRSPGDGERRDRAGFASAARAAIPGRVRDYVAERRGGVALSAVLYDDDQFVRRYTDLYRRWWADRPADEAVDGLRLGTPEDGPPLGRADARSGDWTTGAERAVVDRYRHYRAAGSTEDSRNTVVKLAGLPPERYMTSRLRDADPDELARREVTRACAPGGLAFAGHRALLLTVAEGVAGAGLDDRVQEARAGRFPTNERRIDGWAAEETALPESADSTLESAVTEAAQVWAARLKLSAELADVVAHRGVLDRSGTAHEKVAVAEKPASDRAVDLPIGWVSDWEDAVVVGVTRRLWRRLLDREQEWHAPVVRAEVPGVLSKMLGVHLRDMLRRPSALMAGPEADLFRMENTMRIIRSSRAGEELVALAGRPGWHGRYRKLVERAGVEATEALSPAAFLTFLRQHASPPCSGADRPAGEEDS